MSIPTRNPSIPIGPLKIADKADARVFGQRSCYVACQRERIKPAIARRAIEAPFSGWCARCQIDRSPALGAAIKRRPRTFEHFNRCHIGQSPVIAIVGRSIGQAIAQEPHRQTANDKIVAKAITTAQHRRDGTGIGKHAIEIAQSLVGVHTVVQAAA